MNTEQVRIEINNEEHVSGIVHLPEGYAEGRETGVIVAHGAGSDMHTPLLEAFCVGLGLAGFLAMRFNFPYKEKGKKAPDPPRKLEATWKAAYAFLRGHERFAPRHILGAGKSMGGRIASQVAAAGELPVEKLIFLGYPLHPPGNKEKLRDSHLYSIRVPMLFLAGTRDSLCDLELLRSVLGRFEGPWALEVIDMGDHSFNVLKSLGKSRDDVYADIIHRAVSWLGL
ncbi:MAG: alpha/beta family hydrolase [Candidatus Aminicenantaceae bacterium]